MHHVHDKHLQVSASKEEECLSYVMDNRLNLFFAVESRDIFEAASSASSDFARSSLVTFARFIKNASCLCNRVGAELPNSLFAEAKQHLTFHEDYSLECIFNISFQLWSGTGHRWNIYYWRVAQKLSFSEAFFTPVKDALCFHPHLLSCLKVETVVISSFHHLLP